MFVAVSWLPLSGPSTVYLSSTLHALLHEATRMVSVPLTIPSATSGFHSSFYLGLGWGVAECAWGIVQGWEQLALYEDIDEEDDCFDDCDDQGEEEDLEELEHRVSILQRMQARHELEEVMGVNFPLIPLALHMLWRIDTLLLNLGLTLILSGFYFDPEPLYRHEPKMARDGGWQPSVPKARPSHWLPLAWCVVAAVHVALGLVWKLVGRVGVAPVTWGVSSLDSCHGANANGRDLSSLLGQSLLVSVYGVVLYSRQIRWCMICCLVLGTVRDNATTWLMDCLHTRSSALQPPNAAPANATDTATLCSNMQRQSPRLLPHQGQERMDEDSDYLLRTDQPQFLTAFLLLSPISPAALHSTFASTAHQT